MATVLERACAGTDTSRSSSVSLQAHIARAAEARAEIGKC